MLLVCIIYDLNVGEIRSNLDFLDGLLHYGVGSWYQWYLNDSVSWIHRTKNFGSLFFGTCTNSLIKKPNPRTPVWFSSLGWPVLMNTPIWYHDNIQNFNGIKEEEENILSKKKKKSSILVLRTCLVQHSPYMYKLFTITASHSYQKMSCCYSENILLICYAKDQFKPQDVSQ